jgi:uncharacterized protein (DUF362 family)
MERVYIADCSRYDARAVEAGIRAASEALGITLPQGQPVVLHPACPWAHPRFAPLAFTNPAVIEGAALALMGNTLTMATNSLPGFPTRYSYRKAGYVDLAHRLGARLVAIDEAPTQTVQLRAESVVDKEAALPEIALQAGFTVALPKLTGSTFVSFAGAIRHHQSLLQDDAQIREHHRLPTKMVDLLEAVPPDLIVVDAITATHKGGELSGLPVELGILIIGTKSVAVDAVCAVAYGFDPAGIEYLQLAAERGYGSIDPAQIQVLGDLTLDVVKERAKRVEHVDPYPDHYPLPPQVKVMRSDKSGVAGTCGGLTEVFLILEHGGISLQKARESVIVVGKVDNVPPGKSETATIIFLDDTSRAEYRGYSRVVRLRGRYVPLSTLLNDVPYAMKVSNLRNELGGEMVMASFSSNIARLLCRLTGGAG